MKIPLISTAILFALIIVSCSSSVVEGDLIDQDSLDVMTSSDTVNVFIEDDVTVSIEIDSISLN